MDVDRASAFQDTLERLRQRYALYFYWPARPAKPQERLVTLALSRSTGAEYAQAEVRYRRAYLGTASGRSSGTLMEVSREPDSEDPNSPRSRVSHRDSQEDVTSPSSGNRARGPAVNENSDLGPNLNQDDPAPEVQPAEEQPVPVKRNPVTSQAPTPQQHRGWPRADESAQQH
jgi:hypothetical protein